MRRMRMKRKRKIKRIESELLLLHHHRQNLKEMDYREDEELF
jgi:hypothetical protein